MSDTPVTPETLSRMLVFDLLERWPATAEVINRHAMACIGCALAPFCTVLDAADSYHLSPEEFVAELLAAIAGVPQS